MKPQVISDFETAKLLAVQPPTQLLRLCGGTGSTYMRVPGKRVRALYNAEDASTWLSKRKFTCTAEESVDAMSLTRSPN